jgi:hypothetical protein
MGAAARFAEPGGQAPPRVSVWRDVPSEFTVTEGE